jgi:hypothetical protein
MPFPATFPKLLITDPGLVMALANAITETQLSFPSMGVPLPIAVSIAAIDESTSPPSFKHAGFRESETHYSASLLKVAAMFAGFQLRQSANNFAVSVADATPAALFAHMSASFDPLIEVAVPLISSNPAITRSMKIPKYPSIFVAIPLLGGGFSIVFNPAFSASIHGMIVNSSNPAAGTCVQALGYSWINGVLTSGGFFNPATQQGLWLAGTFIGGGFPPVRITSINDGLVAQAMTCFDMANLYALLFEKTTIDSGGHDKICGEMLGLLAATTLGQDPSWMKAGARPDITGLDGAFSITHTKIGLGPLKPENGGFEVASDASIVQHNPTGKKFITAWQNVRNDISSLNGASFLVERAIKNFLGIP